MANSENRAESSAKAISSMQPAIDANAQLSKNVSDNVGVALAEDKCRGFINLRLKEDDSKGKSIAKKVLGVELPALNQRAGNKDISVLGLGPSEWLIIAASGAEAELTKKLETALNATFNLVCDVTGGTTILNIQGRNAQDLLEKGTYVDLHDSVFKPDALYATQIAHAPAIIVKNASNDFSLVVRRSFSHHIAAWAVDGAAKYGYSFS